MGAPTAFSPFTFHFSPFTPHALCVFRAPLRYLLFAICYSAHLHPASTADHRLPNTHPHIGHGDEPMTS
jgi:hypothetical protein